jgi:hypothetical protein
VNLIDVRQDAAAVARFAAHGLDINAGFVVELDGKHFHGSEAIGVLALLTPPKGVFGRLNRWAFSHPKLARSLYPWLVKGRSLLLKILRRKLIDTPPLESRSPEFPTKNR